MKIGGAKQDFISGFINETGDIIASDEVITHETLLTYIPREYGIHRSDTKWRYYYDTGVVKWWDPPKNMEKILVNI